MTRDSFRRLVAAAGMVSGGALIAAGAWLPWISLYGGLYPLRGIVGPYGRVLLGVGLLAALAGGVLLRAPRATGMVMVCVATVTAGCVLWLLFRRLPQGMTALARHPFLVARPGSGLWVMAAGSALLLASALLAALLPGVGVEPAHG